ncbi:carbon storage regulator [Candidatus Epulonipiscium fishelsonii]|uniref:Carbon storage regulator n=1 Tax=Candidatus Epulonipiscium fishelsonii TaxID=77094 RepID=A0ACC8XHU4_9FIRM|nr:carbon storage regulator [Epulopiscium sp. SCG-D08WGA-EpuloA1]OON94992.1 MAG: carbon storage regulator [Epulopiscium sp. AS2M-Bin002]
MLALTRKVNESIIINGNIEIKVISISDGRVKLGIEAPKEQSIYRKELYLQIEEANKASISNKTDIEDLLKKI